MCRLIHLYEGNNALSIKELNMDATKERAKNISSGHISRPRKDGNGNWDGFSVEIESTKGKTYSGLIFENGSELEPFTGNE